MTKEISRRDFLGKAGKGVVSSAVFAGISATFASYFFPKKGHQIWYWDTGREVFHFIGSAHDFKRREFLISPDPKKEFSEPVDGIFLEEISSYLDPKFAPLYKAYSEGKLDDLSWFGPTIKYCREKEIPLFLGDLALKRENSELKKNLLSILEIAAGSLTAQAIALRRMNRREFGLAMGALGIETWGVTPPVLEFLHREGGKEDLKRWQTQIKRDIETILADRAHPELVIVVSRNAFWAKKLFFLADELRNEGIEYPKIGIIAGSAHRYLDYFLRHPGEIDSAISLYPKEFIKSLVVSKEYLYSLLEINLKEGSYTQRLRIVPELERSFGEREYGLREYKG